MKKIITMIIVGILLANCGGIVRCNTTPKKIINEVIFPICNSM